MIRPTTTKLLAVVLALMLTAAACGGDDDDSQVAVTEQAEGDVGDSSEPASEGTATGPSNEGPDAEGSSDDADAGQDDHADDDGEADHSAHDDAEDHADHADDGDHDAEDHAEDGDHGAEDHAEDGDHGAEDHAEDGDHGAEDHGDHGAEGEHGEHGDGEAHHDHGDEGAATEEAGDADITCGDNCPTPEALTAMETLISAYNAGDWEAFTAAMGTDEPTWETGLGEASTEHIRADFEWAQALNQEMTVDGCVQNAGLLTCQVIIEDDIHRAVVDFGLEPSRCKMIFEVQDDLTLAPARYELTTCFAGYDQAFHAFGDWFEATYPDEEPIQGFHYRAWNQFGEGAPERAAAVIDEWVAQIPEQG